MGDKIIETDSKGIPTKSNLPESPPLPVFYALFILVQMAIFGSMAYFFIVRNNEKGDAKVAILAEYDLGYVYIGAFVLKILQHAMGINLGVARKAAKIHVPDQQVYQVKGAEGSKLGYVLLEGEGVLGRFNRAQRALQNYNEAAPITVLFFALGGFVYPQASLVLISLFSVLRFVSALGYTSSADGRFGGFLASGATLFMLDGLVIMSGIRSILL
uniref:Glutathione transferase n=1 Tax=Attheya septentrionalis TaxID=420275 RepID=A0A7S2XSK6_9STRA|mmetsp:Transcript_4970/g.8740  ORF Transcript_4970/g.8740 Transcript_4970/m.8740 type:complete len:215 (+) Transcript_4970:94-738(+)